MFIIKYSIKSAMDCPIPSISQLKKRIEEIKKIDPNLQYTVQQLEQKRNARISRGSSIGNLLPISPLALAQPTAELASRNPASLGYNFNTDFYRNSIALRKEPKPQTKEPMPEVTNDSRMIVRDEQEHKKALEQNDQKFSSTKNNQNRSNDKGLFMQLNPVLPEKTPQLTVEEPSIRIQNDKKTERNLFESSVPVKQQLGLFANENKTLREQSTSNKPNESIFGAATKKLSSSLFSSSQSSLFPLNLPAADQTSLAASSLSAVQGSGQGKISEPLGQKKLTEGRLLQQHATQGGLFQQAKKQSPKVVSQKTDLAATNLPQLLSTQQSRPQDEPKQEIPKQGDQKPGANLKFSLFSAGLSMGSKKEDRSFFSQPPTSKLPPNNPFSLSQPKLHSDEVESSQPQKGLQNQQVPEKEIQQEKEQTLQKKQQTTNPAKDSTLFPQKEESSPIKKKPEMAIGPGGKGFELIDSNNFFSGDNKSNPNLTFGSSAQVKTQDTKSSGLFGSQAPTNTSFGQTYFNKAANTGGLFSSESKPSIFGSTPSIFGESQKSNIFGENTSIQGSQLFGKGTNGQAGGIFNKGGNNQSNSLFGQSAIPQGGGLFGQGGGLFGQRGSGDGSMFGQGNKGSQLQEKEEQQDGQEDDSGPIEAVDEIDPNKSTGKYDYVQSNVIFKDTAVKFRQGSKQTLQNVAISVESFPGGKSAYLFVRLANKCIALSGLLMPGTTEIRILNNSSRNLEIKKILCQNKQPPELVLVKIQLKDELIGSKLLQAVEKVLRNQ